MYHILLNPTSGKGRSLEAFEQLEKILIQKNVEYVVHRTEYHGHAIELARDLSLQPDTKLIAMGGDGTFNEVLNGIECFENITLGLIPCGTGNDFSASSGHPADIEKAVDIILNGNTTYVDYIQMANNRCINVVGAGVDVDVLLNLAKIKRLKGKIRYYASLLYTLFHLRFHKLRLTIDDGESVDRDVFIIGNGNGRFIGGGMPICPDASIDDGKLSVVVINRVKKSKVIGVLLSFLKGKHIYKKYTEVFEAKKVKIEVLDDTQFEADGEIFGAPSIECEVVSNKLKVFR